MLYHFARCGQEAKVYKCPKCDKTYTSTQGVKYHLSTVHQSADTEDKADKKNSQSQYFEVVPVEKLEKRKAAKK